MCTWQAGNGTYGDERGAFFGEEIAGLLRHIVGDENEERILERLECLQENADAQNVLIVSRRPLVVNRDVGIAACSSSAGQEGNQTQQRQLSKRHHDRLCKPVASVRYTHASNACECFAPNAALSRRSFIFSAFFRFELEEFVWFSLDRARACSSSWPKMGPNPYRDLCWGRLSRCPFVGRRLELRGAFL
jgi:hypothetical protein